MFDQKEYIKQWQKDNYAVVRLRVPKERRHVLDALKEIHGKSINQLIIEAIEQQYRVDLSAQSKSE